MGKNTPIKSLSKKEYEKERDKQAFQGRLSKIHKEMREKNKNINERWERILHRHIRNIRNTASLYRVIVLLFIQLTQQCAIKIFWSSCSSFNRIICAVNAKTLKSMFKWDPKWTQTDFKSQNALKSRSVCMVIWLPPTLRSQTPFKNCSVYMVISLWQRSKP